MPNKLNSLFIDSNLAIRPSQIKMIEIAEKTFKNKEINVIEAPTGTGKSLAYLMSAIRHNNSLKKPLTIIVSTATIALQEQLINKDLPKLNSIMNLDIDYKLSKGRGRYLCLNNLFEADIDEAVSDKIAYELENSWNGDIDTFSGNLDKKSWSKVCSTNTTCSQKRCANYSKCHFYDARREVWDADIIVTNHSLLMSSLALGDGSILPKLSESILIIDECHHLPEITLSSFSAANSLIASKTWIITIADALVKLPENLIAINKRDSIKQSSKKLSSLMVDLHEVIHPYFQSNQTKFNSHVMLDDIVLENIKITSKNINTETLNILQILKKLKNDCLDESNKNKFINAQALNRIVSQLGFLIDRVSNLKYLIDLILNNDNPPVAKWVESRDFLQKSKAPQLATKDYNICASPIVSHELLTNYLWILQHNGILLCSATVRSVGKFDQYMKETGLDLIKNSNYYLLESPFDYTKSQIIVPEINCLPNQVDLHTKFTAKYITSIDINKKGMLVIFTSKSAMNSVYNMQSEEYKEITMMQGDMPKQKIIDTHCNLIDNNKRSIIFGLNSFSEGVDLAGNYLSHLLIHKLPFAVPSNPIPITKEKWISNQGKNSFAEMSLPLASIRLTQACGRLIRRESDVGCIHILDRRIIDKYYGKMLLNGLPDFQIIC